ncbi:hypothetical protein JL722_15083 [Aureococcus anophagefferens]|nr:hypothetical protein JL722_15083 [Aureococcus anophagefferens]
MRATTRENGRTRARRPEPPETAEASAHVRGDARRAAAAGEPRDGRRRERPRAEKIREFVDLGDLYYAGSHGFDIDGPGGLRHAVAQHTLPLLAEARKALEGKLGAVEGCALEDNRFSVSVHWRKCAPRRDAIERVVDDVLASPPFAGALRKSEGKCVFELRPDVAWDKGSAVLYLLDMLRARDQAGGADAPESWYRGVLPVYVGDDTTDEDAFRALSRYDAVSVLVAPKAEAERRGSRRDARPRRRRRPRLPRRPREHPARRLMTLPSVAPARKDAGRAARRARCYNEAPPLAG